MRQETVVRIEGTMPLLMGNGLAADPLNPVAALKKKVSKKTTKTEADHRELERLDWDIGLYLDGDNTIILPAVNFNKSIIEGARKTKKGKQAEAGVLVVDDASLEFPDQGKDLDTLYNLGRYIDRRMVFRNRKSRIVQVRPRFNEWAATFTIGYDDELLSEDELRDWITVAGQIIGIGDYRQRFGKYRLA